MSGQSVSSSMCFYLFSDHHVILVVAVVRVPEFPCRRQIENKDKTQLGPGGLQKSSPE